jgi:hypothetical protein
VTDSAMLTIMMPDDDRALLTIMLPGDYMFVRRRRCRSCRPRRS